MNILVVGYYNRQNHGDDLLNQIAQNMFKVKGINLITLSVDEIYAKKEQLASWTNKLILFGGEVLNSYFLDKLIFFKFYTMDKLKKNIPFYAMGVSSNEIGIESKLSIFENIIFRDRADYEQYKHNFPMSMWLPDPVFLLKPGTKDKTRCYKQNIGFFLSQTSKLSSQRKQEIIQFIQNKVAENCQIILISMCQNNNNQENDMILNSEIFNSLTKEEQKKVVLVKDSKQIESKVKTMDYAICFRYHAHIFCYQYHIPFLSISNTPKVMNLLEETNMLKLCYFNKPISDGYSYLVKNHKNIKKDLKREYELIYKRMDSYTNQDITYFRTMPKLFINTKNPKLLHGLFDRYNSLICDEDDYSIKATILLYIITGKIETPYHWGLFTKLKSGIPVTSLSGDLLWVIGEELKNGTYPFHYKMAELLDYSPIISQFNKKKPFNIHYIDQNDMKGVHRSGWQYVIDHIENELCGFATNNILLDLYVDRTFHWNYDINKRLKIVPYKKPWMGFIHHTLNTQYSNYNVVELFNKSEFLASLPNCRGFFVLSNYLKGGLEILLKNYGYNIPVIRLYHPTEPVSPQQQFNYKSFINQKEKRVIQVGAWYRDISAIFKLSLGTNNLGFVRYALKGPNMDSYYSGGIAKPQISRDRSIRTQFIAKKLSPFDRPVQIIDKLVNDEYDKLFTNSIVFIYLIDASAVNTVIESIVRNTPILVNKIEPVVEYLGEDYPFYYTDLSEATSKLNDQLLIKKTHNYLSKMDKSILQINTFISSVNKLFV